jgi:hypothetical protein
MRARTISAAAATAAVLGSGITGVAAAHPTDERRADVALAATPAAVEFVAGSGAGQVRLDYSNPGNVAKVGADVTAEIPAGITVEARPAPGWDCHIDDFPALVCSTGTTLEPGEVQFPAEVTILAEEPVSTEMEFGTLGFYRDPTENPADNYSTVTITAR